MMLSNKLVLYSWLFLLSGCALLTKHGSHLSLDKIETLKVGVSQKEHVKALLGPPDREIDLDAVSQGKESGTIWAYDEEQRYERISFFFDKSADVLISYVWDVAPSEKEAQLPNAIARYPHVSWEVSAGASTSPHTAPSLCIFSGKQDGVLVQFNKSTRKVEHISWEIPNRVPALQNSRDKKAAVSCMGGKCIPFDPSKLKWAGPDCSNFSK